MPRRLEPPARDCDADLRALLTQIVERLDRIEAHVAAPRGRSLSLAACGETVSAVEFSALLGRAPRYIEKVRAREKATGVVILPRPLEGSRILAWRKQEVAAFIARYAWRLAPPTRPARSLRRAS